MIAIILLLIAILLPAATKAMARARQTQCVSNLRQIGIAMQSFAHDHNGRYPMQVPTFQRGSIDGNRETLPAHGSLSFSHRHFQVLSNELGSPKLVVCPADKRLPAQTFSRMARSNVSYWVNIRANVGNAVQFLSGDWNLTRVSTHSVAGGSGNERVMSATFNDLLHQRKGNILFADGHIETRRNLELLADAKSVQAAAPGGRRMPERGFSQTNREEKAARSQSEPAGLEPSRSERPRPESTSSPPVLTNESLKRQLEMSNTVITPGMAAPPNPVPGASSAAATPASEPGTSSGRSSVSNAAPAAPEPGERRSLADILLLRTFAKWIYLLGLILILAAFVWRYLTRKKKQSGPAAAAD